MQGPKSVNPSLFVAYEQWQILLNVTLQKFNRWSPQCLVKLLTAAKKYLCLFDA